ncbi:MAG: putative membrane protein YfcA, partial [Paracoccaceae bacterium]
MLGLNGVFFALAVPTVLFAGFSKGGFGGGAAFSATSILALVLQPEQALALMLPMLMMMDIAALGAFWKKWSWPDA